MNAEMFVRSVGPQISFSADRRMLQIINFPFPTSPSMDSLRRAEQCLLGIAALRVKSTTAAVHAATGSDLGLTAMGTAMAAFPLSPRHSRMILAAADMASVNMSKAADIVHYALAMAAALSSESPFLEADALITAAQPSAFQSSVIKVLVF